MDMDIERTMQFIVSQQAQFAADIQLLKEQQAATQNQHQEFLTDLRSLVGLVSNIAELQRELASRVIRTDETLDQLAAHAHGSEERLNTLIGIVERHISNHK